jgi:metal-responsive CopG/Arc/MetJ family transcriptional regulator
MPRPSDPKVSIRIPKAILAELDAAAKSESFARDRHNGRGTRSAIIRRALALYFNHILC